MADDELAKRIVRLLGTYAPLPLKPCDFDEVLGHLERVRPLLHRLAAKGRIKARPNPECAVSVLYYLEAA